MNDKPNWIDRLWSNRYDSEAEEKLSELWLRFQADRKEAWEELSKLVVSSASLTGAARTQIHKAIAKIEKHELDDLVKSALTEACLTLGRLRSKLPASTEGVFLPYLRAENEDRRYHWVQSVLSVHFAHLGRPGERERELEDGEQ